MGNRSRGGVPFGPFVIDYLQALRRRFLLWLTGGLGAITFLALSAAGVHVFPWLWALLLALGFGSSQILVAWDLWRELGRWEERVTVDYQPSLLEFRYLGRRSAFNVDLERALPGHVQLPIIALPFPELRPGQVLRQSLFVGDVGSGAFTVDVLWTDADGRPRLDRCTVSTARPDPERFNLRL